MRKQCGALLSRCRRCGSQLLGNDHCPFCGEKRGTCRRTPLRNRSYCRTHGARDSKPMGLLSATYAGNTGWSKHLPTRLMEHYIRLHDDPEEVLSHTEGIKLLHTRQQDLLDRVDQTPSYTLWLKAVEAYEALQIAIASGNAGRVKEKKALLESALKRGFTDAMTWKEIRDLELDISVLRDKELKRREKAANIISEEKFRSIIGYIVNSIHVRVKDRNLKMELIGDLERVL